MVGALPFQYRRRPTKKQLVEVCLLGVNESVGKSTRSKRECWHVDQQDTFGKYPHLIAELVSICTRHRCCGITSSYRHCLCAFARSIKNKT